MSMSVPPTLPPLPMRHRRSRPAEPVFAFFERCPMHASGTAFQLSSRTRPGRKAPLAFALGVLLWLAPATGAAAADVSGHWSGYWLSCTSGHSGPLHAQLCRIDDTT
jgi:hypothetical protein